MDLDFWTPTLNIIKISCKSTVKTYCSWLGRRHHASYSKHQGHHKASLQGIHCTAAHSTCHISEMGALQFPKCFLRTNEKRNTLFQYFIGISIFHHKASLLPEQKSDSHFLLQSLLCKTWKHAVINVNWNGF